MVKHIVTEAVRRNGVVDIIVLIGIPVVRQLFRAKYQNGFVAVLVILDHRQRRERFAETNAVGQNTAVVFFQFVDNGQSGVLLEMIQHPPNLAVPESGGLIGENVFVDIFQKLIEDVVEHDKVNEIRRVLPVSGGNAFDDKLRHVFQLLLVVPDFLKFGDKVFPVLIAFGFLNRIIRIVAAFAAKIDRRKTVDRHIRRMIDGHKSWHVLIGGVGTELRL